MSAHDTCSFCFKSHKEVQQLIVSNDVSICNECVELCRDILGESRMTANDCIRKAVPIPDEEAKL
jgi:ATP-dependent protease Clp ATPase subunit